MKLKKILLLVLVIQQSYSQNKLQGVILDEETKRPIEYADIYNSEDYTSSNEEGNFLFVSKEDSLKIGILGYEPIFTTFDLLKSDTLLLGKKVQNLEEVVINTDSNLLKSIFRNLDKNYPLEPFKERFFLRSILKKNNEIVKLVDFSGKVEREALFSTKSNPMPKRNYSVEIENLRKAGVEDENIDFSLSSFKELFTNFISIYMSPEIYDFKYIPYRDSTLIKLEFQPKKEKNFNSSGYYLVDLNDKAFKEVHISNSNNTQYIQKRNLKYRTTNYEVNVTFKKDPRFNKYVIDKANMTATVEVSPETGEEIVYTVNYKLYTHDNFQNFEVKNNISLSKDIFRLKEEYNQIFWKSQNYLLLTKEMKNFLKTLNEEHNDFKSSTNIKL